MIKAVFFDFDGTLFDTSEGIFHTANFTMEALGKKGSDDYEQLSKFVGPPLRDCFKITFGLEEEFIDDAVRIYRKEYMRDGALRCKIYPQILDVINALHDKNIKVGVCTLKYDTLVKYIIEQKGLTSYFDVIQGTNEAGTLSKTDAILLATEALSLSPSQVLMVGDTVNDEKGAKNAKVSFLGVNWGFGYKKGEVYEESVIISEPIEILNYINK